MVVILMYPEAIIPRALMRHQVPQENPDSRTGPAPLALPPWPFQALKLLINPRFQGKK